MFSWVSIWIKESIIWVALSSFVLIILWAISLFLSWFLMPLKVLYDLIKFIKQKELTHRRLIIIILYLVSYAITYASLIVFVLLGKHLLESNSNLAVAILAPIETLAIVLAALYSKAIWGSYLPFKWMRRKIIAS